MDSLHTAKWEMVEAGGRTAQSFGLNRLFGQIYVVLYLSDEAQSLDSLAQQLGVSKASVSTIVRQLVAWSAVRQIWVKGDRKDYYEAETDFSAIVKNGVLEVARKKINTAGLQIGAVEKSLHTALANNGGGNQAELKLLADRFQRAKDLHQKLHDLVSSPLLEQIL